MFKAVEVVDGVETPEEAGVPEAEVPEAGVPEARVPEAEAGVEGGLLPPYCLLTTF